MLARREPNSPALSLHFVSQKCGTKWKKDLSICWPFLVQCLLTVQSGAEEPLLQACRRQKNSVEKCKLHVSNQQSVPFRTKNR